MNRLLRSIELILITLAMNFVGCVQTTGQEIPVPAKPIVKIESIATMPVHTEVNYFTFSDKGASTLGFGARVYHVGEKGSVQMKDVADGDEAGFRIHVCNPTAQKLALVLFDGKTEVARRESNTRGETITLDVGRCRKPAGDVGLSDFPISQENQAQVKRFQQLFRGDDSAQLQHRLGSVPGVAKAIVTYLNQKYGKFESSELTDWVQTDFRKGADYELKGVVKFERASVVAGARFNDEGKGVLRVLPLGIPQVSIFKAYQSEPIQKGLHEYVIHLSKASFDETPVYPLETEGGIKFDRDNRERYGAKAVDVSVHNTKWTAATESTPIKLQIESKITTESSEFYLLHVFDIDSLRLSSAVILTKRIAGDAPTLEPN